MSPAPETKGIQKMSSSSDRKQSSQLTLVIGASGKTGSRVAARLKAQGVPVRPASRSSTIPFDWHDASTWETALNGVRHIYVSYAPDLAAPGVPQIMNAFATKARDHGIERLVLLSGRGEEGAQQCEHIVLGIEPTWTVVRASWFNQNFSEGHFLHGIESGALALPAGDVREPFIDIDDVAEVAVAALTTDGHEGEIYEVTGPRLLTFAEAVAEMGKATGRALAYHQIPTSQYVAGATAQGAPQEIADLLTFLFDTVLDGRNESIGDGVERALGRPPRDFTDYAKRMAASGVWGEAPSPEGTVRRLIHEVFNLGRTEVVSELVHEDYVYRTPSESVDGPAGLAALVADYRRAFPDLYIHIDDLVASEDTTMLCFTLTGTHLGDLLGMAATGRRVKVNGVVRSRFRQGRIADEWELLDMQSLLEQVGIARASA